VLKEPLQVTVAHSKPGIAISTVDVYKHPKTALMKAIPVAKEHSEVFCIEQSNLHIHLDPPQQQ
jgi:hypothetical protein